MKRIITKDAIYGWPTNLADDLESFEKINVETQKVVHPTKDFSDCFEDCKVKE